jgi:hypothetical protein
MELDLKDVKWGEFKINDIFNVHGTFTTHPSKLVKGGKVPRITCAATNNGFEDTYHNKPTEDGRVITIDSATIGYISYQAKDFIATDHVEKISLKNGLTINKYLGLFIVSVVKHCASNKYGYGYKFSQSRIKKQKISLPINSIGQPDYAFMEQYMRYKEQEKIDKFQKYIAKRIEQTKDFKEVKPLNEKDWGEFFLEDVLNIKAGKRLIKADMKEGEIPFIGASDSNNGITNYISNTNSSLDSNVLGVNYNGSVAENFYHPYKAIFSDDVKRLSLKDVNGNEFLYLFVKTIILKQKSKFQYAYKFNEARMLRQKLLFPINEQGKIDYSYMENYIMKLEYEKLTKYLAIKNKQ